MPGAHQQQSAQSYAYRADSPAGPGWLIELKLHRIPDGKSDHQEKSEENRDRHFAGIGRSRDIGRGSIDSGKPGGESLHFRTVRERTISNDHLYVMQAYRVLGIIGLRRAK